jgi:hypothetical protein
MDKLKQKNVPKLPESLMGTPMMVIVQLLILMAKHYNDCVFLPVNIDTSSVPELFEFGDHELSWDGDTGKLHPPLSLGMGRWVEMLRNCTDGSKRFVVMPLTMYYYKDIPGKELKKKGHLNILIYDKLTYVLERYEPNGQQTPSGYNSDLLDIKLPKIFKVVFKTDITYVPPVNFCPPKGLQYLENLTRNEYNQTITRGTCSLWSIVYADIRLTYPNKNRNEIHDLIVTSIRLNKSDLYEFIVDYLNTIARMKLEIEEASSEEEISNIILGLVKKQKKTMRRRRSRHRKMKKSK